MRIPHEFVSLLASLVDDFRGEVARKWAETEELFLDGWSPDAVSKLLDDLCLGEAGRGPKELLSYVDVPMTRHRGLLGRIGLMGGLNRNIFS